MDAAAAAEAAKVITDGDTSFTKIRLSSKALSPEAAATLADAFRSLPGLVVADLSDIIAGRPEAEGLAVYEALGEVLKDKPLVEIDLSDNALGPKGVKACTAMLTGQGEEARCPAAVDLALTWTLMSLPQSTLSGRTSSATV